MGNVRDVTTMPLLAAREEVSCSPKIIMKAAERRCVCDTSCLPLFYYSPREAGVSRCFLVPILCKYTTPLSCELCACMIGDRKQETPRRYSPRRYNTHGRRTFTNPLTDREATSQAARGPRPCTPLREDEQKGNTRSCAGPGDHQHNVRRAAPDAGLQGEVSRLQRFARRVVRFTKIQFVTLRRAGECWFLWKGSANHGPLSSGRSRRGDRFVLSCRLQARSTNGVLFFNMLTNSFTAKGLH